MIIENFFNEFKLNYLNRAMEAHHLEVQKIDQLISDIDKVIKNQIIISEYKQYLVIQK